MPESEGKKKKVSDLKIFSNRCKEAYDTHNFCRVGFQIGKGVSILVCGIIWKSVVLHT